MKIEVNITELRKKKIFVGTPMYGGMCTGMYTKASCDLATTATKYGMDVKFFYLFNESLITRARNYLVDEFLRSPYTHLMFIDSDINFQPQDVLALATMCDDDKPIIGGPYPKKCIAWEKVRNAVDAGLADENPNELEKYTGDFVFNPTKETTQIKIDTPSEVLEVGTGFVMIQRQVFENSEKNIHNFLINLIIIVQNILMVLVTFMRFLILLLIMKHMRVKVQIIQIVICLKIICFVTGHER